MTDRQRWEHLLSKQFFAELAYFAGSSAWSTGSPEAHLFAGIGCCGLVAPLANGQRILDGDPIDERAEARGDVLVSPTTLMPYAGLEHLLKAVRADPALTVPEHLRQVTDDVADDLAYADGREIRSVRQPRSHGETCVMAAVLLRRLTAGTHRLPRVHPYSVEHATAALDQALTEQKPA